MSNFFNGSNSFRIGQNTCFRISFEGHILPPDVRPGDMGPYAEYAEHTDKQGRKVCTKMLYSNPKFIYIKAQYSTFFLSQDVWIN